MAILFSEVVVDMTECDGGSWSCPRCGSGAVGRISTGRYYCHDCCVEFTGRSPAEIYSIDDEGNLISVDEKETE